MPIGFVSAGMNNVYAQSSEVTISMNGQTQEGNGNFKHFINHSFYTDKNSTGLPSLNARRLFSIINIYIGVPPGDYKAAVLQTDDLLITEAKLDLATGELKPKTTSTTQVLTLKDIHISTRQTPLVLCVPIIPCNMSGHELSVKVYDDKGYVYAVGGDFKGRQFEAGVTYNYYTGRIPSSATPECTGLPVVMVNTSNGDSITSKDYWMEGSTLTVIDNDGQVINSSGKVKGRGNNTWLLPKKPYAIKFSKKQSPFGFPANKDWILLAEYFDRTMLRTAFMSAVSRAAEIEFSIHYQHVNLFVNGIYQGVYVLTDKIEKSPDRVNIEDDGFIIEDDNYYQDEKVSFISSLLADKTGYGLRQHGFSFKYPDDDEDIEEDDENYNFIKDYVYQMEDALSQLTNDPSSTDYQNYIDVTSFAKFHVACAAFVLLDPNCFYVLPSRSSKLKMMPIWDAEWSLGLRNLSWGKTFPMHNDTSWDRLFYFTYLMKSPGFIEAVKTEWAKFKEKKQQILDEISLVREQISTAQADNFNMWPDNRQWLSFSFDTWEEEVENVLQFFDERLEWLDGHYASMNQYTITYVIDGEVYATVTVDFNSKIVPLTPPSKDGFDFAWEEYPETMPAHDITINGAYTTTGILSIAIESGKAKIFTLDGRQVDTLQKGINIIRMDDGTTKKVVLGK